jgi:hypothetical protein
LRCEDPVRVKLQALDPNWDPDVEAALRGKDSPELAQGLERRIRINWVTVPAQLKVLDCRLDKLSTVPFRNAAKSVASPCTKLRPDT